eukprot:GHVU01022334.1.p1 GENE.GHVU01022334.1~~GHVU01022334.1.p1  ORF type:complete len:128 (-),score=4.88 GHVU01022334.1:224-580(-)
MSDQIDADQVTCSICIEDIDDNMAYAFTPCHHLFHPDCIKNWIRTQGAGCLCPMCKKPLKKITIGERDVSNHAAIRLEAGEPYDYACSRYITKLTHRATSSSCSGSCSYQEGSASSAE